MAKTQAEFWEDLIPLVKKVTDAADGLIAPPVPDDSWAMKVNQLKRASEGLKETLDGRVESEREQAEL